MERLKTHGIEPGANDEVLVSVDGEARWAPRYPGNADEGDVLTWIAGEPQWAVGGSGGGFTPPEVIAAASAYHAQYPYTVAVPSEALAADEFLIVLHWLDYDFTDTGPGDTPNGWTRRGWASNDDGTTTAWFSGPPQEVNVALGTGPAQIFLIAVGSTDSWAGAPGQTADLEYVLSADGWSNLNSADPVLYQQGSGVRGIAGPDPYGYAGLTKALAVDFDQTPEVRVEWYVDGSGYALEARDAADVLLTPVRTENLGNNVRATTFRRTAGSTTALKFWCGPFSSTGPGYEFWIRRVQTRTRGFGESVNDAAASLTLGTGPIARFGDLALIFGGAAATGVALTQDQSGAQLLAARDADPGLTGAVWSYLVPFAGPVEPTITATGGAVANLTVGVAVAKRVGGAGGGNEGDDELPAGGNDGDVLTKQPDGSVAWEPPTGGGGDGLPGGAAEGEVLTWVNGVATWQPPAAPTTQRYLVPLTTVVGGEPALVWTEDNQLVFVEETLT